MNNYILVINAGSSSIKCALYALSSSGFLTLTLQGSATGIGTSFAILNLISTTSGAKHEESLQGETFAACVTKTIQAIKKHDANILLVGVGHRIVHGGTSFLNPVVITDSVLDQLEQCTPFAPLHHPLNMLPIKVIREQFPEVRQVACFDTGFHQTQDVRAQTIAIPKQYRDEGVRNYGFHGISYEYIASQLSALSLHNPETRVIVAHLGNGSSMCGMRGGTCVATTMGFSTLPGLLMGTRPGTIDPGVLLYLMQHHHLDKEALEKLLYKQSGLVAISGISSDMRELLASPASAAKEAVELFVYRACRELGSLAAALGGLDALIFTGGIGERSPTIRGAIAAQSDWLGLQIDELKNAQNETTISQPSSKVSLWVIPTDENRIIADHVNSLCSVH